MKKMLLAALMACPLFGPVAWAQDATLDKAAAEQGAVKTTSGLVYRSLKDGTGASPKETDEVLVDYRGTFPDGKEFDSSWKRGAAGRLSAQPRDQVLDRRRAEDEGRRQGQAHLPGQHRLRRARHAGRTDSAQRHAGVRSRTARHQVAASRPGRGRDSKHTTMAADSTRAILFALGANAGIAVTKFAAAAYTGSGAMLAEGIHSVADTANQLLLLLGMKRSKKAPTVEHPLGYQRVTYFYGMMVALLLFLVGGLFSIYEGWHRLTQSRSRCATRSSPWWCSAWPSCSSRVSLWGALREIRKIQTGRTFFRWFRETRQSELMVVAGEDIAALGGLVLAFIAVLLSMWTGNPLFDALGSIAVGVLLVIVSVAITLEIKGMIVGESAEPALRAAIEKHITEQPEVRRVIRIITLQWGAQVVVAVRAEMTPVATADALVSAINRVEASLQAAFPQAHWVFFEPDR